MKKEYLAPRSFSILLKMQAFCASFDNVDNTEKWKIEDEETI